MGKPMDRSKFVFGVMKQETFDQGFPSLEDAVVNFVEFEDEISKRYGRWHLARQNGLMPCGIVVATEAVTSWIASSLRWFAAEWPKCHSSLNAKDTKAHRKRRTAIIPACFRSRAQSS